MRTDTRTTLFLALLLAALLAACEPMAVQMATPQVIVVTAIPSSTPPPTLTPTLTPTVTPTPTPANTRTPTPMPCMSEGGFVDEIRQNRSEVADGENLRYNVYLPPCYGQSQRRFPVVYLLHGATYTETQWPQIGTIDALERAMRVGSVGPMILVMPFLGNIGIQNTFPPNDSYETVLLEELVPTIDRDFCTLRNPAHRAVGGISRGGFWALSVGLRHPDVFGAVGGHSAEVDIPNVPVNNNPLDLARNAATLDDVPLRIYVDNGADDPAGVDLRAFSNRLTSREIPHTYSIFPEGAHNNAYWSSHVGEYLEFYGGPWETDINSLPSCLEPSP